jgi:hypothetical protein
MYALPTERFPVATTKIQLENNVSTLRAQACRFQRSTSSKKMEVKAWEPGIAFLNTFDVSDVSFIVDAKGKTISKGRLWDYELLQLRVDGYIAIELTQPST